MLVICLVVEQQWEKPSKLREQATEIFDDATFTLLTWRSNRLELEDHQEVSPMDEKTVMKQQLRSHDGAGLSILSLGWTKKREELRIPIQEKEVDEPKRSVLPRISTSLTLEGKLLCRIFCDCVLA